MVALTSLGATSFGRWAAAGRLSASVRGPVGWVAAGTADFTCPETAVCPGYAHAQEDGEDASGNETAISLNASMAFRTFFARLAT